MIKPKPHDDKGGRKKKVKQPTQKTPMQRVLVITKEGKRLFVWRPW